MKRSKETSQLLLTLLIKVTVLLVGQIKPSAIPHIQHKGLHYSGRIEPEHPTNPHRIFMVSLLITPKSSLTYSLPVFSGDPLDSLFTRLVKKTASSLSYSTPPTGPVYSFNSPGESGDFYSPLELN